MFVLRRFLESGAGIVAEHVKERLQTSTKVKMRQKESTEQQQKAMNSTMHLGTSMTQHETTYQTVARQQNPKTKTNLINNFRL